MSNTIDSEEADNKDDIEEKSQEYDNEIFIVPTSHASEKSEKDVREAIENVNPDVVGLELDSRRIKRFESDNIQDLSNRSSMDIIKNTKGVGLKGRIILVLFSFIQSKVASKLGVDILGLDMKTGFDEAKKRQIPIALVDKDIQDTFKKFTNEISFLEFTKTMVAFIIAYFVMIFGSSDKYKDDVESTDISEAVEQMENYFPTLKRILIDERDEYIANSTIEVAQDFDRTLIVIGAAHKKGVENYIQESDKVNLRQLYEIEEYADLHTNKNLSEKS